MTAPEMMGGPSSSDVPAALGRLETNMTQMFPACWFWRGHYWWNVGSTLWGLHRVKTNVMLKIPKLVCHLTVRKSNFTYFKTQYLVIDNFFGTDEFIKMKTTMKRCSLIASLPSDLRYKYSLLSVHGLHLLGPLPSSSCSDFTFGTNILRQNTF